MARGDAPSCHRGRENCARVGRSPRRNRRATGHLGIASNRSLLQRRTWVISRARPLSASGSPRGGWGSGPHSPFSWRPRRRGFGCETQGSRSLGAIAHKIKVDRDTGRGSRQPLALAGSSIGSQLFESDGLFPAAGVRARLPRGRITWLRSAGWRHDLARPRVDRRSEPTMSWSDRKFVRRSRRRARAGSGK